MLSLLPDLAPRDSHSLWYTSSRNPVSSYDHHQRPDHAQLHAQQNQRRNTHIIDRSPLARLRADEQTLERRLHNVANFGTTWLKPPGIPKTLHQLREERREQEEHQEAMRREQLAQELAEAEAAGGTEAVIAAPGDPDAVMRDAAASDAMDDVQLDGARDLDDDIPEADDDFLGGGGDDESDDEEEEEEDEESEESSDDDNGDAEPDPTGTLANAERTARLQRELMTQMMRRQPRREGVGEEDEVDEEYQQQMIEEEDVAVGDVDADDMEMEVDLDDEIPEAESAGGYEHTDTEADLSSDDGSSTTSGGGQGEVSFAAARAPAAVRFRGSLSRSEGTRHSLAVSDLLSADGDSMLNSSPHLQRRV